MARFQFGLPMNPPRFQFTIPGMLWATFWLAVSFAALSYGESAYWEIYMRRVGRTYYAITPATLTAYVVVASLCAAGGALFGQHKKGLIIGLIAAAGGVCSTLIEMMIGGQG